MMEISAILECIQVKSNLEAKRFKKLKRKEDDKEDLDKINNGKNTVTTFFMTNNSKANKVTTLTNNIAAVIIIYILFIFIQANKDIECYDIFLKLIVLQLSQAAIPFFKKDKVRTFNEMINEYSLNQINNSMAVSACFSKIIAANK